MRVTIPELHLDTIDVLDTGNYYEARYKAAVASAKAAGEAYEWASGYYGTLLLAQEVAASTYCTAVLLMVHAYCAAEGVSHPSLWVETSTDSIDNDLYVAVCNGGEGNYQGRSIEYYRVDGSTLTMKMEEW